MSIIRLRSVFLLLLLSVFCPGCSPGIPSRYEEQLRPPELFPDYAFVTIPPNIAPMNFSIEEPGDRYLTRILPEVGSEWVLHGQTVDIPLSRWKKTLAGNRGKTLRFEIFVRENGAWKKFKTVTNRIAEEPIDPWIFYRLIEPGYERYRDISLVQRNLESFSETPYFHSLRMVGDKGQCANCHSFQARRTENMLFHTRAYKGGTVIVKDGKPEKYDLNTKYTISGGVYPSWHPYLDLVAFSTNKTSQAFHVADTAKVEVLDSASDLVLYDIRKNEISYIIVSPDDMETYPHWSSDGKWLYYCSARLDLKDLALKERREFATEKCREIRYKLMRISFDPERKSFGEPELIPDPGATEKSTVFPRLSPDGRHLLFVRSDFGCFPIWHKESDLWIMDMETGERRPLDAANSSDAESFPNWSSDGRWIVFTSRRGDGLHTRLYFSYFDRSRKASKAFLLPQKRPRLNVELLKSFNVPEFTVEPVRFTTDRLVPVLQGDAEPVLFREKDINLKPKNFGE